MSHVHKTYIGIDPGKKGAVAILTDGHLCVVQSLEMLSTYKLFKIIEENCSDYTLITLERVHSRPLDGRKAAFSFGKSYGEICAICEIIISSNIVKPYGDKGIMEIGTRALLKVSPAIWKKRILGEGKHDKQDSINKAKKLYPGVNLRRTLRCTVDDDNMAEAVLIAHYGYKFWEESDDKNN